MESELGKSVDFEPKGYIHIEKKEPPVSKSLKMGQRLREQPVSEEHKEKLYKEDQEDPDP